MSIAISPLRTGYSTPADFIPYTVRNLTAGDDVIYRGLKAKVQAVDLISREAQIHLSPYETPWVALSALRKLAE